MGWTRCRLQYLPMAVPLRWRLAVRRAFAEAGASYYRVRNWPWLYRALALGTVPLRQFFGNTPNVRLYLRAAPYTLLSFEKFIVLCETCRSLQESGLPGDIVQCGVWNGGSAVALVDIFSSDADRRIFLLDSWEGQPTPSPYDVNEGGNPGEAGLFRSTYDVAKKLLLTQLGADPNRTFLVKGWFEETLPGTASKISEIAFAHIDCDYYEPVRICLETLFPALTPGGVILVDDYDDWKGCKRAVDEFVAAQPDRPLLDHRKNLGALIRKKLPSASDEPPRS
jgi:O-methyltransferase